MGEQKIGSLWPITILVYLGMVGFGFIMDKVPFSELLYLFSFILFLPMMYVGYIYGAKAVVPIAAGLFITYNVMIGSVYHRILILFLLVMAPGILGIGLKEKFRFRNILLLMTSIIFAGIFGMLYYMQVKQGISIQQLMEANLKQTSSLQNDILQSAGVSSKEIKEYYNEDIIHQILMLFPGFLLFHAAFQSFMYFLIARGFIKLMQGKSQKEDLKNFSFSKIYLGKEYAGALLVTIVGMFIMQGIKGNELYVYAFSNIAFLLFCLFALEGLSYSVYIAVNKTKLNQVFSVLFLCIIFFFLGTQLSFILAVVGLLDTLFDFRHLQEEIQ